MIPYARMDMDTVCEENVIRWIGVDDLLLVLRRLPTEQEFKILVEFLVEFSGGLELARNRMAEMPLEQYAISYKAHSEAVRRIKRRICNIYEEAMPTQYQPNGGTKNERN